MGRWIRGSHRSRVASCSSRPLLRGSRCCSRSAAEQAVTLSPGTDWVRHPLLRGSTVPRQVSVCRVRVPEAEPAHIT